MMRSYEVRGRCDWHCYGMLIRDSRAKSQTVTEKFEFRWLVVVIDGLVKLYKSVKQFKGMNNIYTQVKNYVLRTVHQGIFGGHVSSSGPAINRVQEDIGLRQSSLMSDAALVLSISTSGEASLPVDSLSPLSFRESLEGTRPTTHTKSQSVSKTTNFLQKN